MTLSGQGTCSPSCEFSSDGQTNSNHCRPRAHYNLIAPLRLVPPLHMHAIAVLRRYHCTPSFTTSEHDHYRPGHQRNQDLAAAADQRSGEFPCVANTHATWHLCKSFAEQAGEQVEEQFRPLIRQRRGLRHHRTRGPCIIVVPDRPSLSCPRRATAYQANRQESFALSE